MRAIAMWLRIERRPQNVSLLTHKNHLANEDISSSISFLEKAISHDSMS